ncbi:MAG: (2Fe-2S)-binding protein [Planctomycetota bacterium]|nr:MAG: (2Fe-2S)-binding protein [Planctomycetota bacterium]
MQQTPLSRPRKALHLRVNGHDREVYVRDADTLLDVLREAVGLTGTKRGCDLGTCGCCAVQIDGRPVLSCLTLAAEAQDAEITTVEGLAGPERFTPLQQAWAEAGASQCGFCTAGFLMTADALLREHPAPSREQIKAAVSGNLCRCTGFIKIVDAIARSAAAQHALRSPCATAAPAPTQCA